MAIETIFARSPGFLGRCLLTLDGERLVDLRFDEEPRDRGAAASPILLDGLIDLQVNGWNGVDFNQPDLSLDDLDHVARGMAAGGVTRFLPTVVTASREDLLRSLKNLGDAIDAVLRRDKPVGAMPVGVHLEGPYLSGEPGAHGAHPAEHCRDPDPEEYAEFQRACGQRIRLLTLAPERAGAVDFLRGIAASGVIVSIGHTAADGTAIGAAADAGAMMSTHLGNGCAATLPRHPNLIWEQLAEDRLVACFIADGHHLPDATTKAMLRAKGLTRSMLVSDVQGLGGKPPGRYSTPHLGDVEVLPEGRAVVAGQRTYLAGAVARLHDSWPAFHRATGSGLGDWSRLVSARPLAALAKGDGSRTLPPLMSPEGDFAMFVEEGERLRPALTIVSGQVVFRDDEVVRAE